MQHRDVHNEARHNLASSPNIVGVVESSIVATGG
jgi:hypothetical protein